MKPIASLAGGPARDTIKCALGYTFRVNHRERCVMIEMGLFLSATQQYLMLSAFRDLVNRIPGFIMHKVSVRL